MFIQPRYIVLTLRHMFHCKAQIFAGRKTKGERQGDACMELIYSSQDIYDKDYRVYRTYVDHSEKTIMTIQSEAIRILGYHFSSKKATEIA